ncbi:MAG TPA: hypothetical protein VFA07_18770 [Chthonomonadaceae bacterium]|nr:hypothetical protein [Chthonomonadaceae bacterium]
MVTAKRLAQRLLRHSTAMVRDRRWTHPRAAEILQALQHSNPPVFDMALFNFTIDFELLWGNGNLGGHGHTTGQRLQAARAQRENFAPFVRMLEELQFPISWAVVGKLIEPEWPLTPGQRFQPEWHAADWYALPNAPELQPEDWQGGPFLDAIRNAAAGHEVLSHGYAHIDYGDPATTEEIARTDMQLSKRLLEEAGFSVSGFVFPCNHVGHAGLLPSLGYRIARGGSPEWRVENTPVPMTPVGFCINPGFFSVSDLRRIIDEGIARRSFVHPWMHLVECSLTQRDIDHFYRPLFEYILMQQDKGAIRNVSFTAIADHLS